MRFLLGRRFWWFLIAFHLFVWVLIVWILSMTSTYIVGFGTRAIRLSKPELGVLLWLVVAGPATVVAFVLRWLRAHE
jgi:hypothetical protein